MPSSNFIGINCWAMCGAISNVINTYYFYPRSAYLEIAKRKKEKRKKPKSEPNFECRIEFDLYLMVDIQFKCIACDQSIKLSNVDANATQIMNAYALTHRRPYGKCDAKFN